MASLITDEQSLVGAKSRFGASIPTYDDSWGKLYIMRGSLGVVGIVRARRWEDAYSICEDEFFPEAYETIEELQKEYGFKHKHVKIVRDMRVRDRICERPAVFPEDYPDGKLADYLQFVRWELVKTPSPESWPENELFCEAYGFRPNGPNSRDKLKHGIYAKDLNGESLDMLTEELVGELEITLDIREDE